MRHLHSRCRADTHSFRPFSCCTAPTRSGQSRFCFQLQRSSSPTSPAIRARADGADGTAVQNMGHRADAYSQSGAMQTNVQRHFLGRRALDVGEGEASRSTAAVSSSYTHAGTALSADIPALVDAVPAAAGQQAAGLLHTHPPGLAACFSAPGGSWWLLVAPCPVHRAALPGIPGVI